MCESEIDNLHSFILLPMLVHDDHDVLWFEVSVYDSHLMQMLNPEYKLPDNISRYLFLHSTLLPHIFEQILPLH